MPREKNILAHQLSKYRSLYTDVSQYLALPEDSRFKQWAGSIPSVDNKFFACSKGSILLDIGCGSPDARGAVNNIPCSQYIGVDFLSSNSPSIVATVDHLSLKDNSVDTVNCVSVLEHVYNPKELIAEIYRVLKPKGVVRIQVPFLVEWHGYPDDFYRYTHSALQRMFEEAGFRVLLLETDWTKGVYLNAALILESGSWGFAERRLRFLTRILAFFLFRFSAKFDKYYAIGHRGIYKSLALLVEKPLAG